MKFDVLCLSETWLRQTEIVNIDEFKCIGQFARTLAIHGGVSIFVRSGLVAELIDLEGYCLEFHCEVAGVMLPLINTIVFCVYRSPVGDINVFINMINDLLNKFKTRLQYKIIICGDLNIDFCSHTNKWTKMIKDFLKSWNLLYTIEKPTRVSHSTATCLDNIIVNFSVDFHADVLMNALSDHYGQYIRFKVNTNCFERDNNTTVFKRSLNEANINRFVDGLRRENWSDVHLNLSSDLDLAFRDFHNIFCFHFETCFPKLKKVRNAKKNRINWITEEIRQISGIKRSIYELVRKFPSNNTLRNQYLCYSSFVRKRVNETKKLAYTKYIQKDGRSPKSMWSVINGLNSNNPSPKMPSKIKSGNTTLVDKFEIATEFNSFFASTSTNLNLPAPKASYKLNVCQVNSIFLRPTDENEVSTIIGSLSNSSSVGWDDIPSGILKVASEWISHPIAQLINQSLEQGIFPNLLKQAIVKPIYKSKDSSLMNNFRPISLLPSLSKVFEKIIHKRLLEFLTKHKLINDNQFGFLPGKNTELAIFTMIRHIVENLTAKYMNMTVFLDLSKAFDCVNHGLLLSKLERCGVRGTSLSLIESYLTDRTQRVSLSGTLSDQLPITSGVPQGSVLGPLLFILFINDLPYNLETDSILFADDTSLMVKAVTTHSLVTECQRHVRDCLTWFRDNSLQVNIAKTQVINFTRAKSEQILDLNVCNTELQTVYSTKFLGVFVDCELNWKTHVAYVTTKCSKYLYLIRQLSTITDPGVTLTAYYGLIYPQLKYGVLLWGNSTNSIDVFIVQKAVIRAIFGLSRTESCFDYFKTKGLLTLPCIYIFEAALFVKKNPTLFETVRNCHTLNTRQISNLHQPFSSKTFILKNCYHMSIRIYNNIPNELKLLPIPRFKFMFKQFLVSKAFYDIESFFK